MDHWWFIGVPLPHTEEVMREVELMIEVWVQITSAIRTDPIWMILIMGVVLVGVGTVTNEQ